MTEKSPTTRVFLAAGGTGGHLFPALALSRALKQHSVDAILVTDQRGAKLLQTATPEVFFLCIRARGWGARITSKLRAMYELLHGCWQAYRLLIRYQPQLVVGFGGYAALPTVQVAHLLGVEVIVHEQNALLGKTNRLRLGKVRYLALSFPHTAGIPRQYLAKTIHTGNPVSPAAQLARDHPYPGLRCEVIRLLCLGGSQGASIFTRVLPPALALLPEALRSRLQLTVQARGEELSELARSLDELVANPVVGEFFNDIPEQMAISDLVLARAGASTIAELTTVGRPAILVPYPHAAHSHQDANARVIEQARAAVRIPQSEFTSARLARSLMSLLTDPDRLTDMAQQAAALGMPQAGENLAQLACEALAAAGKQHCQPNRLKPS